MKSMTGYGRGEAAGDGHTVTVEASSVNKRNLEVSCSMAREWQPLEAEIQSTVRSRSHRGKFHIHVSITGEESGSGLRWNEPAVLDALARLRKLADAGGIEFETDGKLLLGLVQIHPDDGQAIDLEGVRATLQEALGGALDGLCSMRQVEGGALDADLRERLGNLLKLLEAIRRGSEGTVSRYRTLLHQRLTQAGLELELEDERVLREIALFADRCDIAEEVTRLASHLEQFGATIDEDGPIGRKLEFISQEIHREFNTIGSKGNSLAVTQSVVEAKSEIDRIREQLANVE